MFATSTLIRGVVALMVLSQFVSTKFVEEDFKYWMSPMDDAVELEFAPHGPNILEMCWLEGHIIANGSFYGKLVDCYPNKWHCVMNETRELRLGLYNIHCTSNDTNVFGKLEHLCAYRWFTRRHGCDSEFTDCYYAMLACDRKYLGTRFWVPVLCLVSFVLLIILCSVSVYIHHRYFRTTTMPFLKVPPSKRDLEMAPLTPVIPIYELEVVERPAEAVPRHECVAVDDVKTVGKICKQCNHHPLQ